MSKNKNTIRAPLAKVRGLGSAREGTGHFITQRVTAVALLPSPSHVRAVPVVVIVRSLEDVASGET